MRYSKYPSYRDSGVEWLGEIPEHWIATKVKYKAPFQVGWTPPTKNEMNFIGDNTWITIGDLKGSVVSKSSSSISDNAVANASMDITPKGSLLYSFKLSVGTVAIAGKDLYTNEAIASFIKNKHTYIPYLYYATPLYIIQNASENIYGAKILNQELIKNANLTLPSFQEQQTIANYLDIATAKIDTLIDKQTKLIELLKEKRQAVISTAVTRGLDSTVAMKDSGIEWLGEIPEGWKNYRIDWIAKVVRGNSSFKKDELLQSGEYVALQYGKTYKVDEVDKSFSFYVNDNFYKPSQVVHSGNTILISTSETVEDLAHSCFYNRDDLGLIGGEQILLKPDTELVSGKYLYYFSKVFNEELRKYATGLKVFRFNIDDLKNIFMSIPPVDEQQTITNYIEDKTSKIDTLITKSTKAIDLLKEKRTALISSAVTGKIDVREMV